MALIKCPECKKNMSDKAEKCPHCGYTLNKTNSSSKTFEIKWDNKYFIVLLILVVGVYFIFFNNGKSENGGTNEPTKELKPNANGNYEFNEGGKYFEFPTNYKVYIAKDKTIYIGQNIDNQGALIPYISIEKYSSKYTDPAVLLDEVTTQIGKAYSDARITISMLTAYINDKYTYGIQYTYSSSGHTVVDNRYAFLVNNSMYLVTTKEENVNTTEINNVTELIIKSLKEVN